MDISQTRASRNLGILHGAGFLKMRKEGLWALYSIDREGLEEYYSSLVLAVEQSLASDQEAARDRNRLRTAQRVGPGRVNRCAR